MKLLFFSILCVCLYSCQQEPDILLNPPGTVAAEFSLAGSPNTCSNVVPAGVYKKNIALGSSNKIAIDVTVTKMGEWTASTNTVNGVLFTGSGNFSISGIQTITLQGAGVPTQSGPTTFIINAGGNHCSFNLTVDTSSAPPVTNIPPAANAGPDKLITLPVNSVTLAGLGTDPDGAVVSYAWTRISGPGAHTIISPSQAQTVINGLVSGNYEFALKVTDNLGATDTDTVIVVVQGAVATGSLTMQQDLFAVLTPLNLGMHYDGNGKIIKITSNHYPERRITYANNRIATIEHWFTSGSMYKGSTETFVYDTDGNVTRIDVVDHVTGGSYVGAEFTYNTDKTIKARKSYFSGSSVRDDIAYSYTNGNLTSIIYAVNTAAPTTVNIEYDTRTNKFKDIYSQNYFLDVQTAYGQNNRSEMFYFSNNYPTKISTLPVSVSINPTNQKPFEVKFDNVLWYRYIYN